MRHTYIWRFFNCVFFFLHWNIYFHTNSQHLSKQCTLCRISRSSWTCYNCVGLDLEHNTGDSSQVGQRGFALRRDEVEISQQVASEQKELHFGNGLPQAEPGPPSERDQGMGGASSSFQKALWKKREKLLYLKSSKRNALHVTVREQYLVWSCTGQSKLQDRGELQTD